MRHSPKLLDIQTGSLNDVRSTPCDCVLWLKETGKVVECVLNTKRVSTAGNGLI